MTDRIKIVCSNCRRIFNERAQRLKQGYQTQCPHCMRLITFDSSSDDPDENTQRLVSAIAAARLTAN